MAIYLNFDQTKCYLPSCGDWARGCDKDLQLNADLGLLELWLQSGRFMQFE